MNVPESETRKKEEKMKKSTKKLTTLAMLSALSVILAWLIRFSIIPAAPFLEYDPADIPILLTTFMYGPLSGLLITVIVSVLQGMTVSAASGYIGIIMHILSTGSYVIVAGLVYHKFRSKKGAALALALGSLAMTVVMVGCNLVITPIFLGQPMESVISLLLPAIIPFNLIKAGLNGILTFQVYKPLRKMISKM